MVLSLSPVSEEQGRTYYKRDNYYTKDQALEYSGWWGKGAESFGLKGEVSFEEFDRLLHGLSPDGKDVLSNDMRRKLNEKRLNAFAKSIDRAVSRALRLKPRTDPMGKEKPGTGPRQRPGDLEALRDRLVAEAITSLSGKTQTPAEIKEAREKLQASLEGATRTMVFLGGKGEEGLKIARQTGLGDGAIKLLKEDLKKAYRFTAQGTPKDKKALGSKKKEAILQNVRAILEAKGVKGPHLENAMKVLGKDLGETRPSAKRVKTITGHVLNAIGEGMPSTKVEQISLRKALKGELSKHKTMERRAAMDMTFSAPKSISIQALVFEKQDLVDAHRRSVAAALKVIEERYSHYRGGTKEDRTVELSGKLTVAQFEHDTSRAKDPDLHTHNVAISLLDAGKDANGKPIYKAFHNEELYKNSKIAGAIYQNELARECLRLGYELVNHGNCTFDIKGYSKEQLDAFSKRRQQILEAGGTDAKKAREKVLEGRAPKGPDIPRAELLERWRKEGVSLGLAEVRTSMGLPEFQKIPIEKAMESAIKQASERSSTFRKEQLEQILLENFLGHFQFSEISVAVQKEIGRTIFPSKEAGYYVSIYSLKLEQDYRQLADLQRGNHAPLMTPEMARDMRAAIAQKALDERGRVMTPGQKDAIEKTLQSKDGIIIWQGVAGAGKTDSLRPLVEHLQKEGFTVKGYAQAASAAQQLSEGAGIKAETLETMLIKTPEKNNDKFQRPEFWVVDEASFISSKDMVRLLEHQKATGARIVLTGDIRQLSAVEAGNPFLDLQKTVFKDQISELNQSVRQKDERLREAVAMMNKGDIAAGLKHIDERIQEVSNAKRPEAVAKYYLGLTPEERERSIIVARTNLERHEIKEKIVEGMKAEGRIGAEHRVMIYEKKDIPNERLGYAVAVTEGDYLVPNKDIRNLGLKKNEGYEVLSRDVYRNEITVKPPIEGMDPIKLNLLKHQGQLGFFKAAEIRVHDGDKLAWTRNQRGEDRLNNDRVKLLGVEDGKARIQYESGREESIDLSKRHFLDQALVITTNKSQGMSKYRNIVSVDSGKQQEALYVDVTRATNDLVIFCEDKDRLYEQAERSGANKIASGLVMDQDRDAIEERIKELFPDPIPGKEKAREIEEPDYGPGYFAEEGPDIEVDPDLDYDGPDW